uniref:Uncharacterized protein n=1 Tax=Physcomitrium patens TaxID=3218 RepID=A0A7I3YUG5_PHYPA
WLRDVNGCRLGRAVLMPEWLSGMTRNHVGSARAGSNPAEHDRSRSRGRS